MAEDIRHARASQTHRTVNGFLVFPSKSYDAMGATGALAVGEVGSIFKILPAEEGDDPSTVDAS